MAANLHIEFDPDLHAYHVNGERWPSVTQVLDLAGEYAMIPRDVLARAAEFGTNVHTGCHLLDMGTLDWNTVDPALVGHLRSYERFLAESGAVVLASEVRLAHPTLKYAGTLDKLMLIDGVGSLVDIKSGSVVPRTVGMQTAAYAEACEGVKVRRRYALHLRADGYRLIPQKGIGDMTMFLSFLNVWKFINRMGDR